MDSVSDDIMINLIMECPYRELNSFACTSRRNYNLITRFRNDMKYPEYLKTQLEKYKNKKVKLRQHKFKIDMGLTVPDHISDLNQTLKSYKEIIKKLEKEIKSK